MFIKIFSNYDQDDIRSFNFLYFLLLIVTCSIFFKFIGSLRISQYITFNVQNNANVLIDFTTQIFFIIFF